MIFKEAYGSSRVNGHFEYEVNVIPDNKKANVGSEFANINLAADVSGDVTARQVRTWEGDTKVINGTHDVYYIEDTELEDITIKFLNVDAKVGEPDFVKILTNVPEKDLIKYFSDEDIKHLYSTAEKELD